MSSIQSSLGSMVVTASLAAAAPAALALAPRDQAAMLVFAPLVRHGALEVMAKAQARLVRTTPWGALAIVSDSEPGLSARLYAAGATLVLRSNSSFGCPP